jgi:hypothetical protein
MRADATRMKKGEPTAPSKAVIKRLFARSGNRCAFPNCTVEIAQGDALIGEMCHIKAASPNGPRYDPQQKPAGRHGYDNIILLCANHHTVIDGDEETYTVDCLVRMKTDHEGRAAPIADDLAERGARRLLIQPLKISVGESGRFVSTKGSQLYDVQRTLSLKVDGRIGNLKDIEDAHRDVIFQIRKGAGHPDEPPCRRPSV